MYPIKDGNADGSAGFSSQSVFADGYAQFNNGSGWVGWDPAGYTPNQLTGDLPFYFTVQSQVLPAAPSNLRAIPIP
jgi:hypothetical protein